MPDSEKYGGYEDQFAQSYDLALQQLDSRFLPHVTMGEAVIGEGAQVVKHLQPFEVNERTSGDLSPTRLIDAAYVARWAFPVTLDAAIPITQTDLVSMNDPSGSLQQGMAAAMMRGVDKKIIIPALFRDVVSGKDKESTIPFPSSQKVSKDEGGADSGLNPDKADAAFELFQKAEVDPKEAKFMGCSARQQRWLRSFQRVNNKEFEALGGVIEDGLVTKYLGFHLIHTQNMQTVTIGGKLFERVPAWTKRGVVVTPWLNGKTRMGERADRNYTLQLYQEGRWGATRVQEELVVEILCNVTDAPAGVAI